MLLLDQFPRNMFRAARRAYATDPAALDAADGRSRRVRPAGRAGTAPLLLPAVHALGGVGRPGALVALNEASSDADAAQWARHHRDLIARFGRFPHRNAVLGRESTAEEQAFLAEEGAFKA